MNIIILLKMVKYFLYIDKEKKTMKNLLRFRGFVQKINENTDPQIKEGGKDDPYKYKKDGEDFYFAKKGTDQWKKAVKPEGIESIKKIFTDKPVESKKPDASLPDKNEKQTSIELLTQKVLKPTSSAPETNFRIFKDGRFQYQTGKNDQGKSVYSPVIKLSYGVPDSQYIVKITDIYPDRVRGRIKPPRKEGSSEDSRETQVMTITFDPEVVWKGLNEFIKTKPQKNTHKEIGNTEKREYTDLTPSGGPKGMANATYPLFWTIT